LCGARHPLLQLLPAMYFDQRSTIRLFAHRSFLRAAHVFRREATLAGGAFYRKAEDIISVTLISGIIMIPMIIDRENLSLYSRINDDVLKHGNFFFSCDSPHDTIIVSSPSYRNSATRMCNMTYSAAIGNNLCTWIGNRSANHVNYCNNPINGMSLNINKYLSVYHNCNRQLYTRCLLLREYRKKNARSLRLVGVRDRFVVAVFHSRQVVVSGPICAIGSHGRFVQYVQSYT
jgi:hypothetical protein